MFNNIFIEYGKINTNNGDHMVSNITEMSNCNITHGECFKDHGVVVWGKCQ